MAEATRHSDRRLLLATLGDPSLLFSYNPVELDRVLRLLRRARLLAVVAERVLDDGPLEGRLVEPAVDQLLSAKVMADARARVARWELDRLAWALDDLPEEVPLIAMKGCAYLLGGAPNARGRLLADVDLMVPELHLPDVEARLRERGWRMAELTEYDENYYRVWTHELPPLTHVERGVEVDLHHNILMRTARLKPSAELLLAASRPVPGLRFRVLAPVDQVLHAMVHLFYGGELDDSLRELVDIDSLLRHFSGTLPDFWEQFWPRVEALDLARPAFYGLRYAAKLLGTPVPAEVLRPTQAGAPSAWIVGVMDGIVQRSLFPRPFEGHDRLGSLARSAAYLRSHWVKMPPAMLARHLGLKLVARFRTSETAA
jgi:hypothetical protein